MTKIVSLLLAYSLLVHEVHIIYDSNVLYDRYLTSNLVILLSLCILLKRVEFYSRNTRTRFSRLSILFEILATIVIMELFLYFIWNNIKKKVYNYMVAHSDDVISYLSEERGLDWLVCHLCCGQSNCSNICSDLLLKCLSFTVLLSICYTIGDK